ncbi:hypothetical protein DT076_00325 [Desertihabitans brevis]|uniref:Sulfatase N-terminal domain-containing protein n=1 Tax=Desertihabitans brevis TaxID=2268447 RepID=A0A367YYI5_9ACTN|nr:sulfatase [Desertihabitans brevis]RCK70973.1 hypothetical protein DT076_00325 [Desertihabitans brevis]
MTSDPARPHVLLLHCHDLGRHLHSLGARTVTSPHLDRLAADGVVVAEMFATAPQCSPSRSSLFTGRWPHANGVLGLTHAEFGWDLHADERHLAQRLGSAGYRTELIGMHHESRTQADDRVAERLGFDRVRTGGHAEVVADRAEQAIVAMAASDQPTYLQVGFVEPHRMPGARDADGVMGFLGDHVEPDTERGVDVPGYLRDDESARTEVAELQGAIRHMDAAAGRVLDALDRAGLRESTLVVFTTDHGLALPRAKCTLYDPGLEVACLVRWPARGWAGGRRLEGLHSNLDLTPTVLDAVGVAVTGGPPLHGRSFASALDGRPDPNGGRQEVFGELTHHDYYDPRRCIRTREHKLIANFSSAPGFMDASQSWTHRTSVHPDADHPHTGSHPAVELYDLGTDPLELHDLADHPEHAATRDDLLRRLHRWMRETGDPLLTGAVTPPLHTRTLALLSGAAGG